MIAGTGSQTTLIKSPDQIQLDALSKIEQISVGGWGNILGDQGSGIYLFNNIVSKFCYLYYQNTSIQKSHRLNLGTP